MSFNATIGHAQSLDTSHGSLQITREIGGLEGAWGFSFLPDGQIVVTEKRGRIYLVDQQGELRRVEGAPDVQVVGQGGLLDVAVARDFAQSQKLYFTYVTAQSRGVGTAVASARLNIETAELTDLVEIFQMAEGSQGGRHFGSRIVEAPDGTLFVSIGDRGDRPSAQDISRHNGSIIRINPDGSTPADNPFPENAAPEIWSFGHRNPQGMAMASDGTLYSVEHGAKGGDEVNRIERGANYGWPVISYGEHYSGRSIGEGVAKAGMEQPLYYWDPSMAPSGMMIYDGEMFPDWRGDIFIGSLKFDYISRLSGDPLTEVQQISSSETKRVRDVRQAPDGSIWFISEDRKALYRLHR